MTELSTWCERVLHGTTLADKLCDPGRLTDERPGPVRLPPAEPGRPDTLALSAPDQRLPPPPSPAAVADPTVRADLLRRFAHHELQALELMAAVLLRFPDADPAWRRTLATTLRDEQRHLGLYLDRAAQLAPLEDAPGSRFFWDLLRDCDTPDRFVAGMSLTLEQANLDFLSSWRAHLSALDDPATVAVLDEVYRDEVRHVRHGVTWLTAWSDPEEDLFDAWTRRLEPPLSARRGRGPTFDPVGRERAGLPAAFVTRVRAAGASKGRHPRLCWFAPWVEQEHALPGYTPPKRLLELASDLAPTVAALCGEDDVLLVPRAQDPAFVADLAARGWPVPERVQGGLDAVRGRTFRGLMPWGTSATTASRTASLQVQQERAFHADTARLARKDTAAVVLGSLADDPALDLEAGVVCTTVADVEAARGRWARSVVKVPWDAAGRGLHHGDPDVARLLARHGALVVEPWRDRVLDLSLQARITDQGVRDVRLARFLTGPGGDFRGVVVGDWRRGLSSEILRFLTRDGREPRFVETAITAALHTALDRHPGHRGPIGVDALVARIDGELRLRPLVELNPRLTFGRVGLAVGDALLDRSRGGAWLHVSRRNLRSTDTFADLAARLHALAPPRGLPLREGALATTDPSRCTAVWTVLIAADSAEHAAGLLDRAIAGA